MSTSVLKAGGPFLRLTRGKMPPLGRVQARAAAIVVVAIVVLALVPTMGGAAHVPTLLGVLSVLMFAYAWHPVAGVLGELSLAHLVSWGAGGYTLVKAFNAGWGLVPALLLSAAVGAAIAAIVVVFASAAKLEGLYLFVFTLVTIYFAVALAKDWDWLGGNIGLGLNSLPLSLEALYYAVVAYVAVLCLLNAGLLAARRGLVWLAIRDDPERVAALGWSRTAERLVAYSTTGAMCGVGGALHIAGAGYISPESGMSLALVVVALLAIYVGGPGTLAGPLFGVALLEGLSTAAESGGGNADTAQWALLLQYSAALVIVTFLLHLERRRRTQAMVAAGRAARISDTSPTPFRGPEVMSLGAARGSRPQSPLVVDSLAKSFGGLRVLQDVSFTVEPGEVLGLVGPNGAGKSTICNIIAGNVRPDSGSVLLGDRDVASTSPHIRARLGLGRTYQTPKVFPSLTLAENVQIVDRNLGHREAASLLEGMGVHNPSKSGEHASLLERRMVEVARLIAAAPQWVLLDEPLAGLTADEHDLITRTVSQMANRGVSVLIIEHLIPAILPVTDRLVVLDGGSLIADGEPGVVLKDPGVVDAYLGQVAVTQGDGHR